MSLQGEGWQANSGSNDRICIKTASRTRYIDVLDEEQCVAEVRKRLKH